MAAYLSKTDFKAARTCATKLYYRKLGYPSALDEDEYLQFLADGGYMVEAIAKLCYPDGIEIGFDKGPEESAAETMRLLKAHETITLFEATLLSSQRLARVDILRKNGNTFELIEVKAKSLDTSKSAHPFRGARGNISSEWQPYLEDVAFQYGVLRQLFPEAKIVPYLCLADKAKTTGIHSLFSNFEFSASTLSAARFRRPNVFYTSDGLKTTAAKRNLSNVCPHCHQDLNEGVCRHWVASLSDDSDGYDTLTPLYFGWTEHMSESQEKMVASLNSYFKALCALCEQVAKKGPDEGRKILREAKSLPPIEKATLREAIKLLDQPDAKENYETIEDLLRAEFARPMKNLFTDFFQRCGEKVCKTDWLIDNPPPAPSWTGTSYFAEDAKKCVMSIIQECRKATNRISKLVR